MDKPRPMKEYFGRETEMQYLDNKNLVWAAADNVCRSG